MKLLKLVLIFSVLLTTTVTKGSSEATKSKTHNTVQQIAALVKTNSARALETLEHVVNINSGTMNFSGVQEVGAVFSEQLKKLGFDVQWIDGASFNRAGHLLATHNSSAANSIKVLLIGHLDTVFSVNDSFQKFERLDDLYIAGPGITDMKGGNVIIIEALSALHQLDLLDDISIKVVLTGDEERSGKPLSESKKVLIDAAKWADVALGFEDGDSSIKTAVIARRGSIAWELNITGKPAHSSQIFQPNVGYGAIFESARILNQFRERLAGVGNLTFNPGLIVGGTEIEHDPSSSTAQTFGKNNVIAKDVKITGGIRALSLQELNNAKSIMQEIVSDNLDQTLAHLKFDEGYPPMAPLEGNKKLLKMYSDISESLGYNKVAAVNPRNAGAADISFTAGLVSMSLDGLGLMGRGGHTKDEAADISSLVKNTQKAAILIHRLSHLPN